METQYIAGVCNIGPQEITHRRRLGWAGFFITLILFVILYWTVESTWWRLFIFLPVTLSAFGFLQAYFHFCFGFARRGLFNFGALGQERRVADEASKAKDSSTGNKIALYAVLIGIGITTIAVLV